MKIGPLKIHVHMVKHGLVALAVITLAILIRLLLLMQGWPHTTMDEGTIGQMALHIAYRGEHPIFFYSQDYMGALEAYLAAGFFRLFGVSLFALRIGLVLLFALFLVSMYLLVSLLYTKKLALFSIFLLSLGAGLVLYRELQAIGGYPETLLFGALAFLLASWLALSSDQTASAGRRRWRLLAYGGWGLIAGLGLWSDLIIIPCIVMSGLLLLFICWRDWRTLAPLCLLLGFFLGVLPFIFYTAQGGGIQKLLSIVLFIYHGRQQHLSLRQYLPQSMTGAFLVALPVATNYSQWCDVPTTLFSTGVDHGSIPCALAQGTWSLGAVVLWISAALLALSAIWRGWYSLAPQERTFEQRQAMIRSCAHLSLLFMAGGTFLLFATSPVASNVPFLNARYLICLLIALPALIYPLWRGVGRVGASVGRIARAAVYAKRIALVFIAGIFLLGTVSTFENIPDTQALNQQQYDLIHNLLRIGARHIYSDFFSCDRIIFQSDEQIICSVMDEQLHLAGDRYRSNGVIVQSDPRASYVFPTNSPQAKASMQRIAKSYQPYHFFVFDGYVILQPG